MKNNFIFYQLDDGTDYTKGIHMCVCKTAGLRFYTFG